MRFHYLIKATERLELNVPVTVHQAMRYTIFSYYKAGLNIIIFEKESIERSYKHLPCVTLLQIGVILLQEAEAMSQLKETSLILVIKKEMAKLVIKVRKNCKCKIMQT